MEQQLHSLGLNLKLKKLANPRTGPCAPPGMTKMFYEKKVRNCRCIKKVDAKTIFDVRNGLFVF